MVVVQLTDLHIGADWGKDDPAAMLEATVAAILAAGIEADAVVVTGDLSENGAPAEYELARIAPGAPRRPRPRAARQPRRSDRPA